MSIEGQPTRGEAMAESIFASQKKSLEQAKQLGYNIADQQEPEKRDNVKHAMQDLLSMVTLSLPKALNFPLKEEKTDIIALNEEDFDNKEYIIRLEVRDTITGEKTPRGRLKISDTDEGVSLQADLGFEEAESPTERVHALLFTHLVQATTEFIQEDLIGE